MSGDIKGYDLGEIRKAIAVHLPMLSLAGVSASSPDDRQKEASGRGWLVRSHGEDGKGRCSAGAYGFGEAGSYRHIHENVYWTLIPSTMRFLPAKKKIGLILPPKCSLTPTSPRRIWLPIDGPAAGLRCVSRRRKGKLAQDVANTFMQKLKEIGFRGELYRRRDVR